MSDALAVEEGLWRTVRLAVIFGGAYYGARLIMEAYFWCGFGPSATPSASFRARYSPAWLLLPLKRQKPTLCSSSKASREAPSA